MLYITKITKTQSKDFNIWQWTLALFHTCSWRKHGRFTLEIQNTLSYTGWPKYKKCNQLMKEWSSSHTLQSVFSIFFDCPMTAAMFILLQAIIDTGKIIWSCRSPCIFLPEKQNLFQSLFRPSCLWSPNPELLLFFILSY